MFEINQSETDFPKLNSQGHPNEAPFNNHSWLRTEDFPSWLLALFSAPVTNWESLQALLSALQLSARNNNSRASAPSLLQHPAALTLLRSTGQSYCSRSVPVLTELGSWHLILGSTWDEKGCAEVYLTHKTNFNRIAFLCNTKSWGVGGKINILNCIWKPTSTKEKLGLRHVVALRDL